MKSALIKKVLHSRWFEKKKKTEVGPFPGDFEHVSVSFGKCVVVQ